MGKLCESSEGTRRTLQGISTTMRTVHGEAMAEATVNGVRLAYELQGHGTPILFLPGTGMVKEAWLGGPAPALADAGYQVVLVDNRGVGDLMPRPPPTPSPTWRPTPPGSSSSSASADAAWPATRLAGSWPSTWPPSGPTWYAR
jgi:hypothetical protein